MTVLNEQMLEIAQCLGVSLAVPLEEKLVVTENGRYAENLNSAPVQSAQEVGPELILDKESLLYADGVQEPVYVDGSVKRYVADNIGTLVILAYLIARAWNQRYFELGSTCCLIVSSILLWPLIRSLAFLLKRENMATRPAYRYMPIV